MIADARKACGDNGDKMREEFEAWAESHAYKTIKSKCGIYYRSASTSAAWRAWKASRAALVVELPDPAVAHSSVETLYTEDVCNALENSGVSYE